MPRSQPPSQKRLGAFSMIYRLRWQNPAYCALLWDEKAMLSQVETSDAISAAGIVRADAALLAQKHPDASAEAIETLLEKLTAKGWIARSGSEIFVCDWFKGQPYQIRNAKNLTSHITGIKAIAYDDLRKVVIERLFADITEVERLDRKPTSADVKALCEDLAVTYDVNLPTKLTATRKAS